LQGKALVKGGGKLFSAARADATNGHQQQHTPSHYLSMLIHITARYVVSYGLQRRAVNASMPLLHFSLSHKTS
jgi:hypothetical protein